MNRREEIQEAFNTYYEGAELGEEVGPARMYQIKAELDASGVLWLKSGTGSAKSISNQSNVRVQPTIKP